MKERVLVAMSGGVDSSVAAAMLVEQGYDVVGATMKLFCHDDDLPDRPCCSLDSVNDARRVCQQLGVPHYVLNLESAFGSDVVENFVNEYAAGRTRNANYYSRRFSAIASDSFILPADRDHAGHVWNQYTLRVPGRRDELKAHLLGKGIGCEVYYPVPMHRQECFGGLPEHALSNCPVSDQLSAEVVSIPVYPELVEAQLVVAHQVGQVLGELSLVESLPVGPVQAVVDAVGVVDLKCRRDLAELQVEVDEQDLPPAAREHGCR